MVFCWILVGSHEKNELDRLLIFFEASKVSLYCPVDIYLIVYVWNKEMLKEIWVVFPAGVIVITGTRIIKGPWANTERALREQRMNRIIEDILDC